MALPTKTGPIRSPAAAALNEYPQALVPPLPDDFVARFPSLEAWVMETNANYTRLLDTLLRKERAIADAVEDLRARVQDLEES